MKSSNKNTKFRLRSQYDADIYAGQVFTEPSICEPNQSLTAQEILNNFRLSGRTGLLDSVPGAIYDEDGDIEDLATLDKIELVDVQRSVVERARQYKERLDQLPKDKAPEPVPPVQNEPSSEPAPPSE